MAEIGHGQKLTRKKERAIAGLLTCGTIAAAAEFAHISEATLGRWLARDDFQASFREAKKRLFDEALTNLQLAADVAINTLVSILQNEEKPAGARVTAARVVLDTAIKTIQIEEIEQRLMKLERLLSERN